MNKSYKLISAEEIEGNKRGHPYDRKIHSEASINLETMNLSAPSMSDFRGKMISDERISQMTIDNLTSFLSHIEKLIEISQDDSDIKPERSDISILLLRASLINCTLGNFPAAKAQALKAIRLHRSSLAFYRLGCALYCESDFDCGK